MQSVTSDDFVMLDLPIRLTQTEFTRLTEAIVERHAVPPQLDPLDTAQRILRFRRNRERRFPSGIFADPAWDMMLDLFVQEGAGRETSVSSACGAAAVPATTALRHLAQLEREGLVERSGSSNDRRRVLVSLAAHASNALRELLGTAPR